MELRHLRYFIAVAEEENVTRAASRLHVSQPALSRQIRDLEEEIGFPLLARGAKSVRLTDAGRVFLSEAQAVMARTGQAVEAARAVAAGGRGDIHVGYAPSLTIEILPRALRHCQQENPGLRVRLHDLSTEEMLADVREEKLHVALMNEPPRKMLGRLVFEEVRRYALCVAMHPRHRLARGRAVTLAQVARERLIGYSRAGYPEYHERMRELFSSLPQPPEIAEEHDNSTSLIAGVESGCGVAVVQQGFECMSGPRLKVRPLTPPPPPIVLGLVRRPGPLSLPAGKFAEAVRLAKAEAP
jgi:LysR family transcriptional regulator, benzoate and cis,cis-muconate-responsive activator of ben and cat genes